MFEGLSDVRGYDYIPDMPPTSVAALEGATGAWKVKLLAMGKRYG